MAQVCGACLRLKSSSAKSSAQESLGSMQPTSLETIQFALPSSGTQPTVLVGHISWSPRVRRAAFGQDTSECLVAHQLKLSIVFLLGVLNLGQCSRNPGVGLAWCWCASHNSGMKFILFGAPSGLKKFESNISLFSHFFLTFSHFFLTFVSLGVCLECIMSYFLDIRGPNSSVKFWQSTK